MMGDESRLARLIDNLVDNAISFSPPGGLVEIGAARVGDEVVISVAGRRARAFPATRGKRSLTASIASGRKRISAAIAGSGLAIARAIVEGHGGRIEIEDRHDGRTGARFVVRFPGVSA